jgi:predicted lysophospholipase L1 biosynthesis ABC-type transport system permease subunit
VLPIVFGSCVGAVAFAWTAGPPDALPGVLLSRQLMAQANVRSGDVVTIATDSGGARAMKFRVIAMYEPTPDPMKFTVPRLEARLHLPDLMTLTADPADPLSSETVGALNLAVKDPADRIDGGPLSLALDRRAPGLTALSTTRPVTAGDVFTVVDRFHWAIAIVTVIGSTAFLLALMVMRAEERRDIIGILRLMGIPSESILIEVLCEGLLIAIAGAVFGIAVAELAQGAVNRLLQWRYDTTLTFVRVTWSVGWRSVAFAVPLGVLAGLAASWTLLRREAITLIGR